MTDTAFYNSMASVAQNLLIKFGRTITLTRYSNKIVDPITGVTPGTPTEYTPNVAELKITNRDLQDERILHSDRKLVMDKTVAPLKGDVLTIDGINWNIVESMPVSTAGIDLIYFVIVRR